MAPDEFSLERSTRLVALYSKYRAELDTTPIGGRWMPYRWWNLSNTPSVPWIAYSQMLGDFSSELANIINQLTHDVHRLRTWAAVISPFSAEDSHEATHEFIDMLGTVALGRPYAIKSRLAFAAGHLSHQANRAKEATSWKDDFPIKNLYLNDIEPYCRNWKKYRAFKLKVEPIAGGVFKKETADFRNTYNHGFSSRFVLGMTHLVSREVDGLGRVRYAFGGNPALDLKKMAALLENERERCYLAFDAFQALVHEQILVITAFEANQTAANFSHTEMPPR